MHSMECPSSRFYCSHCVSSSDIFDVGGVTVAPPSSARRNCIIQFWLLGINETDNKELSHIDAAVCMLTRYCNNPRIKEIARSITMTSLLGPSLPYNGTSVNPAEPRTPYSFTATMSVSMDHQRGGRAARGRLGHLTAVC